jgi:EAL domain-containing protein (putative c-di-GMP-specific phosphodiesterase class I)
MMEDRLLIIDDDGGFRNYVRRVGEAAGFETLATGDATVFMNSVRTWNPSVIVMDLNMPGADGIELLRGLGDARVRARVLIASGVDTKVLDTARRLATERGLTIAGTLSKPIRAQDLKDTLERLREVEKPLLAGALAHAIANDDLELEFQPKIDCRSGQVTGAEALVRWRHPTRGMVGPDQFVPLAEQSGVIHALTDWVIGAAIAQAAAWRNDGLALEMAINVSARNLENLELPDTIAKSCAAAGLPAERLTIELTESAAMGDPAQTMDVLTRLCIKGFRLSIDDFGTGYSSLVQLRRLPFSELKIDKSFITQMNRDPDSQVIVEAVVGLARKLGLNIVAEGVETAAILAAITQLGVDSAQGFFISPPARPERIAEIARATTGTAGTPISAIANASERARAPEPGRITAAPIIGRR